MSDALPAGWMSAPLSALGTWLGGGTPSKAVPEYWANGTIPWVSPKDMKRLVIDSAQDQITEAGLRGSATSLVPARSVLMVTRSGILEHTFPVSVNAVPVTINQDLKAWTPSGVDSLYAAYYLRSRQQDVLRECSKDGTTVSSIDFDQLAKFPMLVAPRAEQQRIVFRIEELFSEIDEGERALERVGRLVERYRQSVLKAAVTGGADLASDAWPATAPSLPAGWSWASIGEIATVSGGLTKNRARAERELLRPFLRVANVHANRLDLNEVHQIGVSPAELPRVLLEKDDLLVVEGNGSIDQIGRVALWDGSIPGCVHQNHLIKVRCTAAVPSWFVLVWLLSPLGRRHIEQVASSSSGLHTLSISKVQSLPVPVPPSSSLQTIRESFDRMEAATAAARAALASERARAAALRQSILKAAFSGQLVPQDPRDEPASALLARLAAQASDAPATPRRRGRPAGRRSSQPNPSVTP